MGTQQNLRENYSVLDEKDVKVTVLVGNGQIGDIHVYIDRNLCGIYQNKVIQLNLGLGKDLHRKEILVVTNVDDVNPKTNWTSVRYTIEGGTSTLQKTNEVEVAANGYTTYYDTFSLQ